MLQEALEGGIYARMPRDDNRIVGWSSPGASISHHTSSTSWMAYIATANAEHGKDVKALGLYKELVIIMAERAWAARKYGLATAQFRLGAQMCFDFGEIERGMEILNKIDAIQSHHRKKLEYKGDYEKCLARLQHDLSNAMIEQDMSRTGDILTQIVVMAKNVGDADLYTAYKIQLDAIKNVFKGKATRGITINKIMCERLIDALKYATLRAGLAFKVPYAEQARILKPICMNVEVVRVRTMN